MRIDYYQIPGYQSRYVRPLVQLFVADITEVPLVCLVDSGANLNRFGADVAEMLGIDIEDGDICEPFSAGGFDYHGAYLHRLPLNLAGHVWEAPVCFVPDWKGEYQLLGHEGFFRHFLVAFNAAECYLTLEPSSS